MRFIGRSRALLGAAAVLLGGLVGAVFAATSVAQSTAIVAMGDSEISGEGAGSYEAATDGPSNYCHRSLKAWIKVVAIKADAHVNLACSGADSSNLTSGQPGQYGEPSQADRLASVAKQYRVKYIFVTVGANDDPDFGGTATRCVYAYVFQTGYGCAQTDGPTWANRVAKMEPKVQGALSAFAAGDASGIGVVGTCAGAVGIGKCRWSVTAIRGGGAAKKNVWTVPHLAAVGRTGLRAAAGS
jgi:lysophospholipase L1-like esterase